MANYRVISSDNHVFEPPDLWTSRARPVFKDRVPQLVREYDGDWWFCNGHRVIGLAAGAQTGMRFEAPYASGGRREPDRRSTRRRPPRARGQRC